MRIQFIIGDDKKLSPDTEKDRRQWQALRNKNRPGTRIIFEVFADRSSAQHRLLWAVYNYAIFASESIALKYKTAADLHSSLKWQFCMERPHYFIETAVYIDGNKATAKVPFSESPNSGIDSEGMKEYMSFALDTIAQAIGIPVEKLKMESENHRKHDA